MQGEGSTLLLPPCDPSRPYTLKCIFRPSDPLWLQEGTETRARRVPECSVRITVNRATTRIDWEAPVMPIPCGTVLTPEVLRAKIVCVSDNSTERNGGSDVNGSDKLKDKGSTVLSSGITPGSLILPSVASRGLNPLTAQGLALSLVRYRLVETDTPLHVGVSTISEPGIYTIRCPLHSSSFLLPYSTPSHHPSPHPPYHSPHPPPPPRAEVDPLDEAWRRFDHEDDKGLISTLNLEGTPLP